MEFTLPAEHRQVRAAVREFCEGDIAPIAQDIEDEARFPAEIFEALGRLDMLGVPVDEQWGGLGGDQLMYALVCEELGRVSGAIGLSVAAHTSLACKPIERFGTDAQRERWLEPLATGDQLGAWALTEPGSGSDASDMDTTAERDGDEYVIDGIKQFITNGSVAGAVLVKAVTDPTAGYDGISTFVVSPADDGWAVTEEWEKLGLNASPTCELQFDDCRIPADRLLGEEGDGWAQTRATLDGGRISLAALSVGLAQGAYEACSHTRPRRCTTGGRT